MRQKFELDVRIFLGCSCIFGSAFFFYLTTVIIKWARIMGLQIDPALFVFSRFLLGFKYVTAIEGSIIFSARILLAAVLGPVIAMDPSLSVSGWVGAGLIFTGNVFLTLRKARK